MPGLIADNLEERNEYIDLVHVHPLLAIHNEVELAAAVQMVESLLDRCTLSDGARMYLEALTKLIEVYEADAEPIGDASDAAVLAHLLEAKGAKQVELSRATGIATSTISAILSGKRPELTREQIGKICSYFRVPVTVFSFEEA
jgi:antitoxin component HigA of HigAB toxin-antitoxin module